MKRGYRPDANQMLLNAEEAAKRAGYHPNDWWAVARDADVLRKGRVKRGRRTFWKATAVAMFIDAMPTAEAVAARRTA